MTSRKKQGNDRDDSVYFLLLFPFRARLAYLTEGDTSVDRLVGKGS